MDHLIVGSIDETLSKPTRQKSPDNYSTSKLQLALDAGEIGIWEWDVLSDTHIWDARVRAHFGFNQDAGPEGLKDVFAAVPSGDRARILELLNAALAHGDNYRIEHSLVWPNGQLRFVDIRAKIIRDENGRAVRLIGSSCDVTELRSIAEQLTHDKAALEAANHAKARFLAQMSHELRTPLNAVLGFGELLQNQFFGSLNDKQTEYVDAILAGGKHLLDLVEKILDFGCADAGGMKLIVEDLDVARLARSTGRAVSTLAGQHDVTLMVGTVADGLSVRGDRTRVLQCLINLASNAIKFNRPDGIVRLTVTGDANFVRFAIADNGMGIPAARQKELFQPFSRLDADLRAVEGAGIGLALSKSLAVQMGGDIGFQSTENKGSTFWLDLPSGRIDCRAH